MRRSSASVEGRVGAPAARRASQCRVCAAMSSLAGSTAAAKRRLDSVYSCVQHTRVSSRRAASAASEAAICAGVPSKRRPQPAENSVSPQNSSGAPAAPCCTKAMWPAVWPGTSITAKRRPSSSTVSPPASGTKGSGMRSRAGPKTRPSPAASSGRSVFTPPT